MLKQYYYLMKPGIIYANALTAIAGFFFASGSHIDFFLFFALLIGACLGLASACIFNNYLDRGIDKKMKRTQNRALAAGTIPIKNALLLAVVTGFVGIAILFYFTNLITVTVGAVGFIDYLVFYTIAKRKTTYSTLVGAISGAMPLVAGYTAVSNQLDMTALILFLLMVFWQMGHFFSIAIYRKTDYMEAKIPVLPLKKGIIVTKIQMSLYILAFCITASFLTILHIIGYTFLIALYIPALFWMLLSLKGFTALDTDKWARKMFGVSLVVLITMCLMLSVGKLLP